MRDLARRRDGVAEKVRRASQKGAVNDRLIAHGELLSHYSSLFLFPRIP